MGKRKTDLSRNTRRTRKGKERRALKRKQMWLEHIASSMASYEFARERVGNSFEMEDNWNAFSVAVARSNVLNAMNLRRNENNYVYISEPETMEAIVKQEAQESVPNIQDVVRVKLECVTNDDTDKQCTDDAHFVNVENINTFKVEPADTED